MKITCQSCQSKYNVADEKVQGKIVKIRCRKCGATIVVNGADGDMASTNGAPAEAPAAGASGEAQWHVNVSDTDQRSMSLAELVDAYNAGTVNQETFIWTDGMEDWKPLGEIEAVVSALHRSAPAAAPAPATAIDAPAALAPSTPAAVQAVAAEPKRAAVKREGRGRDLFGTSDDVQTSASASPGGLSSAVDDGKLTGQRNESSVLFSLAVLTKSADPAPSSQPARSNNREDSGLIDLKALAAKAESMRPAAPAQDVFSAPLAPAPLPFGAPLGAATPSGDEASGKSKLPLFIGLALGAVVLLVLGVVIGVKLLAPAAAAPVATAASNAPAMSAAEATPPATAATPASTATSASEATTSTATPALAAKGHAPAPGGAAAGVVHTGAVKHDAPAAAPATGAATAPSPAAPAPAPKPKAGHDCGCNGDLMCLMQCSTK